VREMGTAYEYKRRSKLRNLRGPKSGRASSKILADREEPSPTGLRLFDYFLYLADFLLDFAADFFA
jgi:hypothetical protein